MEHTIKTDIHSIPEVLAIVSAIKEKKEVTETPKEEQKNEEYVILQLEKMPKSIRQKWRGVKTEGLIRMKKIWAMNFFDTGEELSRALV